MSVGDHSIGKHAGLLERPLFKTKEKAMMGRNWCIADVALASPGVAGSGTAALRLDKLRACLSMVVGTAAPPVTCAGRLITAGALL